MTNEDFLKLTKLKIKAFLKRKSVKKFIQRRRTRYSWTILTIIFWFKFSPLFFEFLFSFVSLPTLLAIIFIYYIFRNF